MATVASGHPNPPFPPLAVKHPYPLTFGFAGWDSVLRRLGHEPKPGEEHLAFDQFDTLRSMVLVCDTKPTPVRGRFASSAMLRSENELLGRCSPRFAVRVYFDGEDNAAGFINYRRIGEICRGLKHSRFPADPAILPSSHCAWVRGDEIVSAIGDKDFHVADALLVPSRQLLDRFHILRVDLGREYGEGARILGTPFAQPLPGIGGGKCAQGAIFMAASLLLGMELQPRKSWPGVCVHGPGEISAIVHKVTNSTNMLPLKGLVSREIQTYFLETDRACLLQANERTRPAFARHDYLNLFDSIAVAYLRGDVPVILPVDFRYAGGEQRTQQAPVVNHAVVLVGFAKTLEAMSTTFLVNDPSRCPFIESTAHQLWANSITDRAIQSDDVGRMICAPVPKEVRFSVENLIDMHPWGQRTAREVCPGLIELAMLLQTSDPASQETKVYDRTVLQPDQAFPAIGELALTRMDAKQRGFEKLVETGVFAATDERSIAALAAIWKGLSSHFPQRWCYAQFRTVTLGEEPRQLWVWDAEKPCDLPAWWMVGAAPVDPAVLMQQAMGHVLAIAQRDADGRWHVVHQAADAPTTAAATATNEHDNVGRCTLSNLKFAVISSISAEGSRLATSQLWRHQQHLPEMIDEGKLCVDLFAFMQRDSVLYDAMTPRQLKEYKRRGVQPSAVKVMAEAACQPKLIRAVAERLMRCSRDRTQIRALTTFLPEISAANSARRQRSIDAAVFCAKLARVLRTEHNQDIRAIEIVCGSRIKGLAKRDGQYFAALYDEEDLLDTLAKALNDIVAKAGLSRAQNDNCCPFAIELEPGPLNAANQKDVLVNLAKRLENTPAWDYVGYNADVAHFHLSKCKPADLDSGEYQRYVKDRIVHAHVSDHGLGVFGDISLAPQYLTPEETGAGWIRKWLSWLDKLAQERPHPTTDRMRFSGIVSLELEAVRSMQMVTESFRTLSSWSASRDRGG